MVTLLAGLLAVSGVAIVVRGLGREWAGLRGPPTEPATGGAFVRALRSVLGGGALVAIAAGWALDVRPLLLLGLVIGAEEMLEIGVVVAAMDDAERRPGSPWRFRHEGDPAGRRASVGAVDRRGPARYAGPCSRSRSTDPERTRSARP
jgi:hypothetical protein